MAGILPKIIFWKTRTIISAADPSTTGVIPFRSNTITFPGSRIPIVDDFPDK